MNSKQGRTQDFLSAGANSTNLHRDLPYTDRVSSQTLCQKKKLVFLAGATAPPPTPCPPAMYGPEIVGQEEMIFPFIFGWRRVDTCRYD